MGVVARTQEEGLLFAVQLDRTPLVEEAQLR